MESNNGEHVGGTGGQQRPPAASSPLPVIGQPLVLRRRPSRRMRGIVARVLLPVAIVAGFACFIVGGQAIARQVWPDLSTAMEHALLTLQATVVAAASSAAVYLTMQRERRRLNETASELVSLLKSFQDNPSDPGRFRNPMLVDASTVFEGGRPGCPPAHGANGARCWQIMALHRPGGDDSGSQFEFETCLHCEVYRQSCPNRLIELGEAVNNLMFLLETESRHGARMRALMLEREKMSALGQISAGVAHEVGNPLSSISSIVQMLKRSRSPASMGEQLDLIDKHIQRITGIVRRMVSLARPVVDRWEYCDVGATLKEAVRLMSFDRRARTVDVKLECPDELPRTYALGDQLGQVFLNLGLNALDAMPNGGNLNISASWTSDRIVVRVKDAGCGISGEAGRRVFEPFFTTKEPGRGTGLGLSVSYGIIQKHGGTIDFESEVGRGTVFTVELPITDQAPEASNG